MKYIFFLKEKINIKWCLLPGCHYRSPLYLVSNSPCLGKTALGKKQGRQKVQGQALLMSLRQEEIHNWQSVGLHVNYLSGSKAHRRIAWAFLFNANLTTNTVQKNKCTFWYVRNKITFISINIQKEFKKHSSMSSLTFKELLGNCLELRLN